MRFLVFNIAVGLALVYLINGGSMPTGGIKQGLADMGRKAEAVAAGLQRKLIVADAPKPGTGSDGHGRDTIPGSPAPKPISKPTPKPTTRSAIEPAVQSPKTSDNQPVMRATAPPSPPPAAKPSPRKLVRLKTAPKIIKSGRDVAPEVARRRAEVLGQTAPTAAAASKALPSKVALKAGAQLMTPAERQRQLQSLAEDMELLYLEKVGG